MEKVIGKFVPSHNMDAGSEHPVFEVDLIGYCSRVRMNGIDLPSVRDVKIHQPLEGSPIITIEFMAEKITGMEPEG